MIIYNNTIRIRHLFKNKLKFIIMTDPNIRIKWKVHHNRQKVLLKKFGCVFKKVFLFLNIIMKMAYFLSCNCIKKCCIREENAPPVSFRFFYYSLSLFFLENSPNAFLSLMFSRCSIEDIQS